MAAWSTAPYGYCVPCLDGEPDAGLTTDAGKRVVDQEKPPVTLTANVMKFVLSKRAETWLSASAGRWPRGFPRLPRSRETP